MGLPDDETVPRPAAWVPPTLEELEVLLVDYHFVEILGRGGMGVVYKAQQRSLDRPVAVKILPIQEDTLGAGFTERFRNEARLLARMNHPGIVHVYDFGETGTGLLYFVMEYVDGTDVARILASEKKLSPAHAASITADVCAALHYAHELGVVHRDVKPANVLVGKDGQVKVADFGIAKAAGLDEPSLTTAGLFLCHVGFGAGLCACHRFRTSVSPGTAPAAAPEFL